MEKQTTQTSLKSSINNAFYDELHEQWYTQSSHPIALLRAENAVRNPWISQEIQNRFKTPITLLDVGCGGGLLTNALAKEGHAVTGIDLSEPSLSIAKKHDATKNTQYIKADAYQLPFEAGAFDVVCAMDILEHVEHPATLIQEASRVLKSGGLFFFHTFNRNLFSYFFVIKGVEWCVKNTPKRMHVYSLFIKPQELRLLCERQGLYIETLRGLHPRFSSSFFRLLLTRTMPPDFSFCFSKNLLTGYCGIAKKL